MSFWKFRKLLSESGNWSWIEEKVGNGKKALKNASFSKLGSLLFMKSKTPTVV